VILIDSNILIDILDRDPFWYAWSCAKIEDATKKGSIFINHVILAEVAPHFGALVEFQLRLEEMLIGIEPLIDEAAYAAGMAFLSYRERREGAGTVLADFLIGGHAQALGATILTRDPRVYTRYFPTVPIIAPSKEDND
jgi:predicted nucleic acid-binding protein